MFVLLAGFVLGVKGAVAIGFKMFPLIFSETYLVCDVGVGFFGNEQPVSALLVISYAENVEIGDPFVAIGIHVRVHVVLLLVIGFDSTVVSEGADGVIGKVLVNDLGFAREHFGGQAYPTRDESLGYGGEVQCCCYSNGSI